METLLEEISRLRSLLGSVLLRLSDLESENLGLKLRVSDLESENLALKLRVSDLETENLELKTENLELKRRLGLTSSNSHKPPSSDGLGKKPAFGRTKGGSVGGQKGHGGHTLKCVSEPDVVELHKASGCSCCGRSFTSSEGLVLGRRQVFDIPSPKLVVTEHRVLGVSCCGQLHLGCYPSGVNAPVQYGVQMQSLCCLLNIEYRIPYHKISQLMADLYGSNVNESTITSFNEGVYEKLAATEAQIKEAVLTSEVVHFDETGMRVEGKLHWFHTACTAAFCYLFVHTKRGKEALIDTKSVLKDFKNWAIHDCWASYFDFVDAKHGLCNAHILRELEALCDNGSKWAQQMAEFLLKLYHESQKAIIVVPEKPKWIEEFAQICLSADAEEPQPIINKRGKSKNTKGRNLLNRLKKHQEPLLAFAFEPNVPFTNNQAERDIRHVKVKQKVAMSFRTFRGAEIYARIQSFVATTRKQMQNTFLQLCNILKGENYHWEST